MHVASWYNLARFSQLTCTGPPQIDFVFDYREDSWEQSFKALRLFAEANGGLVHVSEYDPEQPELGLWCSRQARDDPPPHDS